MSQSDRGWHRQLRRVSLVVLGSAAILALNEYAIAQVTPDNTLGVEKSDMERIDAQTENIIGGAQRGDNLFHSFREFNLGEGSAIYFTNPDGVRNIFSRVTGNNASEILGKLGVRGNANLFFMNPNGMIFGANASLDIRGSFLATTANSLIFDNGFEFSANSSEVPPLLTVNVPIGLQFGENPGSIHVRDEPNRSLSTAINELVESLSKQIDRNQSFDSTNFVEEGKKQINRLLIDLSRNPGLQVQPGRTLALVGGNISLEGGILTAGNEARIELGSVADNGRVSLMPTSNGFTLGYEDVPNFRNIDLFQESLINISGFGSGNVRMRGDRVTFQDRSAIFAVTSANSPTGEGILIQAQHVNLSSNANISAIASGGKSPNVTLETRSLNIQDGFIGFFSIGQGNNGNIAVQATDFVNLIRTPSNQLLPSGIFNITAGVKEGGNVTIQTRQLTIRDGAQVAVSTADAGQGGTVFVNASDIELIGESANNQFNSGIYASSFNRGVAGSLNIETQRLTVRDGANIAAFTGNGQGGTVVVRASDFVRVIGTTANREFPSDISANSDQTAGDVQIETGQLIVQDGGQVTAASFGLQSTGAAGNITIEAGSIYLDNQGKITTETQAGEFGNINLEASQFLLLRRGSRITTDAKRTATGGNIEIDAKFIIAVPNENSDITANAFEGRGGKININTQGIYGLQYRQSQTDLSDITVSSELGVAGIVNINSPEVDPNRGLVNLLVLPETTEVVQACTPSGNNPSEFTITGRGGLPPTPQETLNNEPMGVDWLTLPNQSSTISKQPDLAPVSEQIIEAQGWIVDTDGKVLLVAQADSSTAYHSRQKSVNCHGE